MDKETINKGYDLMSSSSIVICSIVRNSEKALIRNIPNIEKLREKFTESQIIIFENDSEDDTKNILREWSKNKSKVLIRCENYKKMTIPKSDVNGVNRFFSFERISKMSEYRNQYLKSLASLNISFDFVMIIDLDIVGFSLDGIAHSFGLKNHWDVITANGYSYSSSLKRRYHDTYALVELGKENQPQTEKEIFTNQKKWSFLKKNIPLIPVYSAFGGVAIYRYDVIENKRYDIIKNKDRRVEVKCEHFSLNHLIQKKGNKRIFINPNMEVFYERVSLSKIIQYLKNRILKK